MLRLLALIVTVAVGVSLGLLATQASLRGQPVLGGIRSGPWETWPDAGTSSANPYARALFAQDGRLPLPAVAGLRFLATTDDAGLTLEGRCDYTIGGAAPGAEYWTLTVLAPDGTLPRGPDLRAGMTSWEPVRTADGEAIVTLARQARPGNWLPVRPDGHFLLMLSVYDTSLGISAETAGPVATLPSIQRGPCG